MPPRTSSQRTRTPAPEHVVVMAAIGLVAFGLVMVYSASSATALLSDGDPLGTVVRQVVYAALGGAAFIVASRTSAATMRRIAAPALVLTLFLLAIVLIPGVGTEVNGSRRWLVLGGIAQIQPSEPAKLALVLWIAALAAQRGKRLGEWSSLAPFILVTGLMGGLILIEPDLGTAVLVGGAALATLVAAGARLRQLAVVALGAAGIAALSIAAVPYRRERLLAFMDPWSDPEGAGFQVVQAEVALGSGGITGVGLGQGLQKAFYLPEAHTDMILATVGEELGLVGVVGLLATFVVFAWAGFRIALAAPDPHRQAIAAGLTSLVVLQTAVNAGAVMGLVPVTGVPLPFVSFGGSSLIILLASAGLLVNIGRNSRQQGLRAVGGGASGADRGQRDRRSRDTGARRRGGAVRARG